MAASVTQALTLKAMKVKVTACYNCRSSESDPYDRENGFALVKCRRCGLIYVVERPDDSSISSAHKQGVHHGAKQLRQTGKYDRRKVQVYSPILEKLYGESFAAIRSWLDIGCGHGEFLMAVKRRSGGNMVLVGSEPNHYKQLSARSRGLDVSFFELNGHKAKYDCISLLNVWSHLPNPSEFVSALKSVMTERGELLIQTGNTAHLPPQYHTKPYYLPDHLSFASESIVTEVLRRNGFEVVKVWKGHFLQLTARVLLKECVKMVVPNRPSGLRYLLQWKRYSEIDMYMRARLLQ